MSLLGCNGSGAGYGAFFLRYRYQQDYLEYGQGWAGGTGGFETLAHYRDVSAWQHVCLVNDFTNATAADKVRLYMNGVRQDLTITSALTNTDSAWNSASLHYIGYQAAYFDGYMAEFHNVDGTALDPDQFGELDDNGVWRPIEYTGSYGTNGFYLTFDPSATNGIGHDHSGNGNHWTPTGFSTTAGSTYDVMSDTPTTNYATLNPLTGRHTSSNTYSREISDGNLRTYNPGTKIGTFHYSESTTTTQFVRSADGGVYMWESTFDDDNGTISISGYRPSENIQGTPNSALFYDFNLSGFGSVDLGYQQTGTIVEQGIGLTAGDVVTCVVDFDNNTVAFYVNGTRHGYITGCDFTTAELWSPSHSTATLTAPFANQNINLGQQPFQYTPVSGAKPWSTAELPAPAISDPSEHFQTVLDTGANILTSAQSAFSSGLWWIKDRANANKHQLVDSVAGTSSVYLCPSSGRAAYSAPSGNSVAWCWAVPSSSTTDTSGSIDTTVYANTDAGFSIATWAGTGVNATVGHGLDFAPELVGITLSGDTVMQIGSSALASWTNFLELNTNYHGGSSTNRFQGTAPTNTVVSVGPTNNESGQTAYMYSWHSVPGYSKIGKYVGNGNADGPCVYTGFKVGWLLLKALDRSGVWLIYDSKRDPYNFVDVQLRPSEQTGDNAAGASYSLDFLSNGFKIRTTDSNFNYISEDYLYMAFAEEPMGGFGVSPATAR